MLRALAGACSLLFTINVAAENVVLGSLPTNTENRWDIVPTTIIDLANPAKTSGRVVYGVLRWHLDDPLATCPNAFKVKILRLEQPTWGAYTTVGESAPSEAWDGYVPFDVFPGVDIEVGDLIAVTLLATNAGCGGVMLAPTDPGGSIVAVEGELPATGTWSGAWLRRDGALAARLSTDSEVRDGIITVAGSVAGGFGSNFRTALQLTNPDWDNRLDGKLVFRRAGTSGSDTDPSLEYSLGEGETIKYDDLVAQMGTSGLGSVDIVTYASPLPVVTTRVFNDLGAGGTLGFNEQVQRPGEELRDAQYGYFNTPADLTNFRMNVGVRSLDAGAQVIVQHISPSGDSVTTLAVRDYPPNYFEQVALANFLGGTPVANGQVMVRVTEGSALVYASTTDNRTNDSSIVFVNRPD